jgi:hypothetical protein
VGVYVAAVPRGNGRVERGADHSLPIAIRRGLGEWRRLTGDEQQRNSDSE